MIKCVNCNSDCRNSDRYCRNCGVLIRKEWYYILLNILIVLFIVALILIILLLIASYFVK